MSSSPETALPEIPAIPFSLHGEDHAAFADALGASIRETGFAVVTGHDIDPDLIEAADAASKAFFELPSDVKSGYADPAHHYQRGYSPFGTENAKGRDVPDLKEFWHVGRSTIPGLPGSPDVPEVADFDRATKALFDDMDRFACTLMRAIAVHLGLEAHALDHGLTNGNSILRLLHYPPLNEPPAKGSVRAAAHEDINLLTLLLGAEEAGLEVLHRSGRWLPINPPPGAVVINAGDMLSRLTAGRLPSTTHRVVNPAPERSRFSRYSKPFFLHPANEFLIDPLQSCIDEGGTPEPAITARAFLDERLLEIGLAKAKAK